MPKHDVTMAEAKARWGSHTRHCVDDATKHALRPGNRVWKMHHGVPVIASKGGVYVMYFHRNDAGYVYASVDPPIGVPLYGE